VSLNQAAATGLTNSYFTSLWTATLRVAEVDAAAYVVLPAKATAMGYEPTVVGAVVTTEATPEPFVVAIRVTPLGVKVTVCSAMAVPDPVVRSPRG
jgi:hypothetical protein